MLVESSLHGWLIPYLSYIRSLQLKVIVIDLETTVQRIEIQRENGSINRDIDGSVHNGNNRIVCASFLCFDSDSGFGDSRPKTAWYFHKELTPDKKATAKELQDAIDTADIIVAHNAKFDIEYLVAAGFRIPKRVWCTMIGEYILARGTMVPLSLEETAKRRKVTQKASDLVSDLFKAGQGYEEIPMHIVQEYVETDVISDAEIFMQQWQEFHNPNITRKLINIVDLMNDMLLFLVEIQKNGVCIDTNALEIVHKEYEQEREQLIKDLNTLVRNVMGDTPINLGSGADVSMVVYSRKVIDKKKHVELFNIGTDEFGNDRYPPRMSANQFANAVRATTARVERTVAINCPICEGHKYIRKTKKDGTPFKNTNKCSHCEGQGYILQGTGKIAGFKLIPAGPREASINGFKTGADELDSLIAQATDAGNLDAVAFLTKKKRLNAINTYINSFVLGIKRWTRSDNILHANFNQCVARTGRLSSTDPNFQNQPKGRKFPIRRVVVSRWGDQGGCILEADFSGLEFVVAGELSRDSQIIQDIMNRKDVHTQTARIVFQIKPEDYDKYDFKGKDKWMRDENKPYTFAPLYGGQGANEPAHIKAYFQEFFKIYPEHEEWQYKMMDNVMQQGYIQTPSGREYMFPGTRRLRGKRTSNATNIVNYPVQGFATGDLVPLACVRALRGFKARNLKSLLILTVHDSIVVDVYPGELDIVKRILTWAMCDLSKEVEQRWGYTMVLPLRIEIAAGPNWGELETIH